MDLLRLLATSVQRAEILTIVEKLTRDHGYTWAAVGGKESNFGQINIGSDPGDALIERVTNAIDSVLERAAAQSKILDGGVRLPSNPRLASELWFQIPGGRLTQLASIERRQELADAVVVSLHPGPEAHRPVISIRDHGIGMTAAQIPHTILSLGGDNKRGKMYLAGAYGQGGSTAFAFSPDGAVIASRRHDDLLDPHEVPHIAVTFIQYEDLDPAVFKNGRYAYLLNNRGEVPQIPISSLADFNAGTLVRHFSYELSRYRQQITQLTGSLWSLVQGSLFDPVLPLWIADFRVPDGGRSSGKPERRSIVGSNALLSRDDNEKVEHADEIEVILDHPFGTTRVRVFYWVLAQTEKHDSRTPIKAYVDEYRPVIYTMFGQRHGTEDRRFLSDRVGLSYLTKHLIVQVELDALHPRARQELLSTTRDRLKESPLLEQMRERVARAMLEDAELQRLNEQRKQSLITRYSMKDRKKILQRFADLMKRLPPGIDARSLGAGGDNEGRRVTASNEWTPREPLPTKAAPTFIRIGNRARPIAVRADRACVLTIESDAPDGFFSRNQEAQFRVDVYPPAALQVHSRSDFRGGRARIVMHGDGSMVVGTTGHLRVILEMPHEAPLADASDFVMHATETEGTGGETRKSGVRPPEPIPISRDQWPDLNWNEDSVATVHADKDAKIFVNIDNRHLFRLLSTGGYQQSGISRMKDNFLLYVAYYAWCRHVRSTTADHSLSGEEFIRYQEAEMDRLAQTVVISIAATGRLDAEE